MASAKRSVLSCFPAKALSVIPKDAWSYTSKVLPALHIDSTSGPAAAAAAAAALLRE